MLTADIISYCLYFAIAVVLLLVFTVVYMLITPYDELDLIRKGKGAACISFGGTLLGYSLTLGANMIYHVSLSQFAVWGVIAMFVQWVGYWMVARVIGNVKAHMEHNNVAVAGLIGVVGLVLGGLNVGSLS